MQDNQKRWMLYATIAIIAIAGLVVLFAPRARAQDVTMPSLTGCYVGASVGHTIGEISAGGPVGLASTGIPAAGRVGCGFEAGQLMAAVETSYGWMFGDLDTVGIDKEWAVTGLAGFKLTPTATLGGHISWARLTTGAGNIDGWKFGPFVELVVPKSPITLDFRYAYGTWDVSSLSPALDATSHEFTVGFKYRFGSLVK